MKIGIVSHYHNSLNYGGNLQAYALCRALKQYGVEPEQICLRNRTRKPLWERGYRDLTVSKLIQKSLKRARRTVRKTATKLFLKDLAKKRRNAFAYFNQERIPHSPEVYDDQSIHCCEAQYDAFITGSDQVWNLRWYHPAYFLTFAAGKPKFSYGASMGLTELTKQEQDLIRGHVADFAGISVRESQTADMLKDVLGKKVEWVLDPTLLLTREQWNEVCAPRIVKEKYLFCYFLGSAPSARSLAKKLAKQQGLKIVTIPHLYGDFSLGDVFFGDIRLDAPSPEEFLSLIQYADCVFTDSFHATAFSAIYQREYFVFPRAKSKGMDDRIYSLTGLLGSSARFCDTPEKKRLNYLCGCSPLEHNQTAAMAQMERRSRQYIEECLETAKEWMKNHET